MKLLKSSTWSFLAVLVRGISALSINKLFASQLGPQGIALLSHFQNLTAIVTTIPNDGINRGVIRFLSPIKKSKEVKQHYFSAGFYLNVVVFILTISFIILFQDHFFTDFNISDHYIWIPLFTVSMFLLVVDYYFLSIILSLQKTHHYFIIELISSVVFFSIACFGFSSYSISIDQVLIYYMLALSSGFIIVSTFVLSLKRYKQLISFKLNINIGFKALNKFLIMAVSSMLFGKLTDFAVRAYSLHLFSTSETGIWQGAVKISDYYMMAFYSVTTIAYYPSITSSLENSQLLRKSVLEGFSFFMPIIAIGCFSVYLLQDYLLVFLLDESFSQSATILSFQIVADFFKMSSMLLALLLIAQSKLKLFIIGELLSVLVYLLSIHFFLPIYGIESFTLAGIVRYIIYFLFLFLIYRKLLFR